MQASAEEKLNPDQISDEFHSHLNLNGNFVEDDVKLGQNQNYEDNKSDNSDEEEFSFMCGELNSSPIAAEDAFINGQIKPVFPLFGRGSSLPGDGVSLPVRPPVKKIFVETEDEEVVTSSPLGSDEIVGPYCEWSSRKAVEASPDQACKKSNSTGFSRIWRFRELVGRSNSDGRDAFVFLNNNGGHTTTTVAAEEKSEKVINKREVKKGGKSSSSSKTTSSSMSAHEAYLKSKAKEEERRRSTYLPYRPELVGFFTNVNGGLTKNVHPF